MGFHATKFLTDSGAKLVAVSEREGTLVNHEGLKLEDLMRYRHENRSLEGFPDGKFNGNASLVLEEEVDLLVPAALERQIHMDNVDRIRARIIAEAANGPITFDAAEELKAKKVLVIPDLYLNAGGVTVSYFEWLKNLSHVRFGRMGKRFQEASNQAMVSALEELTGKTLGPAARERVTMGADEVDLVRSGLEETMVTAFNEISEIMLKDDRVDSLRTAAFALAIEKVARSYLELGVFP